MVQDLVGKQMRRWEISERVRERFEQDELEVGMEHPVVTISRQEGSGGTDIGKLVAKELDYKLFDKEIINRVSELTGAKPEQIAQQDEADYGVLADMLLHLLEGRRPTAAGYMRALVSTVKQIGTQGDAVIVGRAANYILRDAFSVRIIAPEELRIARTSQLYGIDRQEARQRIADSDRARYRFVKGHFGADWDDPLAYDLVINTEHYSIENAAALIVKGFADRRQCLEAACVGIHGDSSEGAGDME